MATVLNDALSMSPNTTLDEDLTSESVDLNFCQQVSIQIAWTGTAEGNFYIQGSNDNQNWVNVTNAQAAGGSSGSAMLEDENVGYRYCRLFFDSSASTGELTLAQINARG